MDEVKNQLPCESSDDTPQKKRILWDYDVESLDVEEKVEWLFNEETDEITINPAWITLGEKQVSIDHEHEFCQPELLQKLLKAKDIFEELDPIKLSKARCRANPFETIKSVFFMNRAALKIANIDAATDFIFSNVDRNPDHRKKNGPYYFADVCAGPGGFSEYIFWRRNWLFKGFGLTLRGRNDFKISELSTCTSGISFQSLYGIHDDGNACCPENIEDFAVRVKHQSENLGVHFVMADGGFSVEGNENLQEVLSKPLYVAQCLIALSIVRANGHFVTKLFDLLTPFSVSLIYLMYRCFRKVAIFKPNASRPANAERYLVCYGLKQTRETAVIRDHLMATMRKLWEFMNVPDGNVDVREILPIALVKRDQKFTNYLINSNIKLAQRQIIGLMKLGTFCRHFNLVDPKQEELRLRCLNYWRIPDVGKIRPAILQPLDLIRIHVRKPDFMNTTATTIKTEQELSLFLSEPKKWQCALVASNYKYCGNIFASVACNKVFRYQDRKWVRVKGVQLSKGTILYGEIVPEYQIINGEKSVRYSLHVIDALRLGDTSLADLPYRERFDLVGTFCESINQEVSCNNLLRLRPKVVKPLHEVHRFNLEFDSLKNQWQSQLPTLGYRSEVEYFTPRFLLLLKTSEDESFSTTFVLRLLFDFKGNTADVNNSFDSKHCFDQFSKYIKHVS